MWPHYILYVILHNYYGPYAYCSLHKGVAYTRGGGMLTRYISSLWVVTISKKSVTENSIFELPRLKTAQEHRATKRAENGHFGGFRGAMALATWAS